MAAAFKGSQQDLQHAGGGRCLSHSWLLCKAIPHCLEHLLEVMFAGGDCGNGK
jgi:hypothetical protein